MTSNSRANPFRSSFAEDIFNTKYRHEGAETWDALARTLAEDVVGRVAKLYPGIVTRSDVDDTFEAIRDMKFIPGGRYLYYAGRARRFFSNCFIGISQEDTREDWAKLAYKTTSVLMSGGGWGNDYSVYRPEGSILASTGGVSSGPLPAMEMVNEIGRRVKQGGSRRSAIYASLNWLHADASKLLFAKDWDAQPVSGTGLTVGDLKRAHFDYAAPLDMTNVSLNYDDKFLEALKTGLPDIYLTNVRQALKTAEPGFSFNFGDKQSETGRNACTEVTSSDDSDVCNIGSINLSRIDDEDDMARVTRVGTLFLLAGTIVGEMPNADTRRVRDQNRRLGLGLMGMHEWLIARGLRYEVTPELRHLLSIYQTVSTQTAYRYADRLGIPRPKGIRAIAPTGTIGILAGTTTGVEPLFAVAYKRRYQKEGLWRYQYVVDSAARAVIDRYGVDPESIESAIDLAADPERRLRFQADVQDFVDMSISSTLNLPAWGSDLNNEDTVRPFAHMLAKYAPRLRGFTCYPDGARGGQPLTSVPYREAATQVGEEFIEQGHDVCDIRGGGGSCGA